MSAQPLNLTRRPLSRDEIRARVAGIIAKEPELGARLDALRSFGRQVRNTEIHLTGACNIRCDGCWFFAHDFDSAVTDERDLAKVRGFVERLKSDGVTSALLIGGEPTLVPDKIRPFVELLDYVTISTNGLLALPREGFEDVAIAVSVFGGGPLDDRLRAIHPNGRRFSGLIDTALANYRDDPRATFIYALTEPGAGYIEETVRKMADNGNLVSFNFYSEYGGDHPLKALEGRKLLDEALRVKELFPRAVVNDPYYIEALITGRSHGRDFGYDVCPSISVDHKAHAERIANGNPVLPGFNAWGADLETVQFCCTSGHCGDCRDSQAVHSWLLMSMHEFLESPDALRTWLGVSEGYWRQWSWSPYSPHRTTA
ncbi:radical SAM protein [Streptomyces sp. NPDC085524]|uniref:radical SAM protein n=1 Tax=unclassified Streptomyces TaxID=2593676 RepID=UPI0035DA7926